MSKDGPSAGLADSPGPGLTAHRAPSLACDVSVTGEMTLTAHILAVGGIREKVLAATRAGCRKVVLPLLNKEDVDSLPDEVTGNIDIVLVDQLLDAIPHLLCDSTSLPAGRYSSDSSGSAP